MYSLAIDIGTTSTKVVLFSQDYLQISEHETSYPLIQEKPSYAEQDPVAIREAALHSMRQILTETEIAPADITSLSFSSAMHSLMAIDKTGRPLTNLLTWADTRSQTITNTLKDTEQGRQFYTKTGTPIHPMSWIGKLTWIREHWPEIFSSTYKFISIKEFICFHLFGEFAVDQSLASSTGIYNLHTKQWDASILSFLQLDQEKLSPIVPTDYRFSKRTEILQAFSFAESCTFTIGASDGVLANVGAGGLIENVATLTIGTSGAVRMTTSQPLTDADMRTFCYVLNDSTWIAGGATNNGGIALEWFIEHFAKGATVNEIIEEAFTVRPGADGLLFLPFLNGERAPHWNGEASGAFIGMRRTHTRAHFSRAVLEGILYSLQSVLTSLEESVAPITRIQASGGFARSKKWVQLLADISGKPVRLQETYHASALGAVRLARGALEKQNQAYSEQFEPNETDHHIYKKQFNLYEMLYKQLEPAFPKLNSHEGS
ncbi:gluconokinase [Shouchella sp. 1P09AA]|uniref:gluconokinase n=1 Tax=unclassified Shouchella TaxID=2893065 RepID=UPI0039A136DD